MPNILILVHVHGSIDIDPLDRHLVLLLVDGVLVHMHALACVRFDQSHCGSSWRHVELYQILAH